MAFNEPRHERRALKLSKAGQKEGSDTALSSPFFSRVIHRPLFFVEQRPGEKERVYKADLNRRANQSRDKFHFTKTMRAATETHYRLTHYSQTDVKIEKGA